MHRCVVALVLLLPVLAAASDSPDLEVLSRIKHEANENSQVMEHLFHLVEVYGPRITNSKGFMDSAKWAAQTMKDWGLKNAKLEKWGPFGQGWSREYFSVHLGAPQYEQLIGVPMGWSPSTDGKLIGQPVLAPLKRDSRLYRDEQAVDAYIAEWKGQLSGALLMIGAPEQVRPQGRPALHRSSNS